MHVMFIHAPIPGAPFSSAIAALSAHLKRHGHETSLLTIAPDTDPSSLNETFKRSTAEVFAWSIMTCRWTDILDFLAVARNVRPDVKQIAGGAHPTTYPSQTLPYFDALVIGDGETPFLHWLNSPDTAHAGLMRRDTPDPILRWREPDVDDLPDWDRALFPKFANSGNRYEQAMPIAFSRGFCPFSCTFCGVDAYRRVHSQPQRGASRLRTVDRVMKEITRVVAEHDTPLGFAAWDEVIPAKKQWLSEFFNRYKTEIDQPFAVQMRIEQVTDSIVEILAHGGVDYVVIGVETGDEDYRKKFLNKGFTNAQTEVAFERLHDAGIETFCSFMVGLPFETPKMLAQTVRMAEKLNPTELSWKYFTPERGTALIDHPFGANEAMIKMTHCTQADLDTANHALSLLRGDGPRGTFE
jgi:anaerobic magnesium-protoporphyrin IX monomethyl ester cyclase